MKNPDENRRFDTIVGKNKRNALRDVRALRVVSNANNPSGAATMSSRAIHRDASGMPRRAVPERNCYDHRLVVVLFCNFYSGRTKLIFRCTGLAHIYKNDNPTNNR